MRIGQLMIGKRWTSKRQIQNKELLLLDLANSKETKAVLIFDFAWISLIKRIMPQLFWFFHANLDKSGNRQGQALQRLQRPLATTVPQFQGHRRGYQEQVNLGSGAFSIVRLPERHSSHFTQRKTIRRNKNVFQLWGIVSRSWRRQLLLRVAGSSGG